MSSPEIDVVAKDGSGTMTATPTTVRRNSTGKTITFIYKAAKGGLANGRIDIKVPKGWSAPSEIATAPGYVTTTVGTLAIGGRFIEVSNLTLAAGQTVTVTYGSKVGGGPGAKATSVIGTRAWKAREESTAFPFGFLKALAVSPKVKVT